MDLKFLSKQKEQRESLLGFLRTCCKMGGKKMEELSEINSLVK